MLHRLVWWLMRLRVRHGLLAWAALATWMVVVVLGVATMLSAVRLHAAGRELSAQATALAGAPAVTTSSAAPTKSLLPAATERFDTTRRMLESLQGTGFAPEQIRFKFEADRDAGLTRQVAVFTVKAPWSDVAKLLAQLQTLDRSVYIAKLRIVRESAGSELVAVDVQLALAWLDEPLANKGGAP
nr:hypothetical protein [Dyella sp. ASV24]